MALIAMAYARWRYFLMEDRTMDTVMEDWKLLEGCIHNMHHVQGACAVEKGRNENAY